ncbi:12378_t:CDS:2 [Dentiscutata heterogama]|uniref:12378_t:CDS:1 n=1 Tax=Dentiscutata heterogama TaxID=1316150 RepID=A0ACA9NTR8_9GLOM|nr:12378_t:CDS:2 [Dentiscutata heterogama]
MASTYLSDVTDDIKQLYETKEDYDAIIIAGNEPNVKEFQVHTLILRIRSSYFRSAFSSNWAIRNNNGHLVLKKPNISALVFEIILKYLYCGIVDFQSQNNEIILELLVAADELGIQRLINSVKEFLSKNCGKFLQPDPIKMLDTVICHNVFDNLKNVYLKTFNENYRDFLQKDPIKLLHFIIRREEFSELIKLSLEIICENPKLIFNSNEFHQIIGEEFMCEVWPSRHLLPDSLIEDIFRCYLVSSAVPKYHAFPVRWGNINIILDSVLVNKKFIFLLTKWIDNKAIDDTNQKEFRYKFNLLFRSSIHGLTSQIFHQKCDNKGATIVIAKISNSNMLVGGYNPLDWNGNGIYKETTDSFIFSFSDPNNPQSAKLGRVNNYRKYAVYCYIRHGPTFGSSHDFMLQITVTIGIAVLVQLPPTLT